MKTQDWIRKEVEWKQLLGIYNKLLLILVEEVIMEMEWDLVVRIKLISLLFWVMVMVVVITVLITIVKR